MKKIALVLGHPDSASFCGSIARTYCDSATAAGHAVRVLALGDMQFDPILRHGYRQRQELEDCLREAQEAITWASHLVFVYPIWWGSMPALLKGFFDRTLLPGYAFRYRKDSQFWDKLLTGRSAQVFMTMDTPPWYYRFVYGMPSHRQIKRTILGFCGIAPVRITSFGPVRYADEALRSRWLAEVSAIAGKS